MDETELIATRSHLHRLCVASEENLENACHTARALLRGRVFSRSDVDTFLADLVVARAGLMCDLARSLPAAANDAKEAA